MKNTENTENVFLYLSLDHVCLLLCAARSCSKRSLAQREVLREFSCCRKRTVEAGMSRREQSLLCWPTESLALCYLTEIWVKESWEGNDIGNSLQSFQRETPSWTHNKNSWSPRPKMIENRVQVDPWMFSSNVMLSMLVCIDDNHVMLSMLVCIDANHVMLSMLVYIDANRASVHWCLPCYVHWC